MEKITLDKLFKFAQEKGASDLVIVSGSKAAIKVHGQVEVLEETKVFEHGECESCFMQIMSKKKQEIFKIENDVDFAYQTPDGIRVRCNVFMQLNGIGGVFRIIDTNIAKLEDLGLPEQLKNVKNIKKN